MSKRRIPTTKEWFDYKTYKFAGWLYCFMSSSAKFHEKLYLKKTDFVASWPIIKRATGKDDNRTIKKYLKILLDNNYLSEDEENYYFPFVMNNGTYILIDKDLLYNICTTKSVIAIQTFIYLSNRMKMKKELYDESTYNFTLKELRVALGFSASSQNKLIETAIRECLQTLKAEKYIDYDNIYVDILVNGIVTKSPNYQLTFIAETLPQKIVDIKHAEMEFNKDIQEPKFDF